MGRWKRVGPVGCPSGRNVDDPDRANFFSSKPDSPEALRTKHEILGNFGFLAQVRQPGRKVHSTGNWESC